VASSWILFFSDTRYITFMTTQVYPLCHGKMDDFLKLNDLNSNKLYCTTEESGG